MIGSLLTLAAVANAAVNVDPSPLTDGWRAVAPAEGEFHFRIAGEPRPSLFLTNIIPPELVTDGVERRRDKIEGLGSHTFICSSNEQK